jgi:hypothetical protein
MTPAVIVVIVLSPFHIEKTEALRGENLVGGEGSSRKEFQSQWGE